MASLHKFSCVKHFRLEGFFSLFILVFVSVFFLPVLQFSFIDFDDPIYVTQNPMVLKGLSWKGIEWAFSTMTLGHWHPLTWISYMLDISIFGFDLGALHGMNVLIYAVACVFLFRSLLQLKLDPILSFFAVLIFAVHPLRLESVVWISQRKEVLSFALGLGSFLLFLKGRYALGSLIFAFSLLAKPIFVSLPVLLVLYEWLVKKEPHLNQSLLKSIKNMSFPLILSLLSCAQVLFSQNHAGALKSLSLTDRLDSFLVSYSAYFGKFFVPVNNSIFHPRFDLDALSRIGILLGFLFFIFLVFKTRKKSAFVFFGSLWFLISAIPTSGLIPVGGQMFADRWSLIPQIGLIFITVSLLQIKTSQKTALSFLTTSLLIFMFATQAQLPNWKNTKSIFERALRLDSDNFMAHSKLGDLALRDGEISLAETHFRKTLQIAPYFSPAWNNLGLVYTHRGDYQKAKLFFERALNENPSLIEAQRNLELSRKRMNSQTK